ncbi:MAG: DNA/RNA non-specific endonuclease [Bacteroidetes bacterium]|nr:DNA/RNA non-specific endonuclease [Bacteroidota bacterium]MBM3424673.1 DNA/RNA non-specific endonuclease [Bacteroidota bacterium]
MKKITGLLLFVLLIVIFLYGYGTLEKTEEEKARSVLTVVIPPDSLDPSDLEVPIIHEKTPVIRHKAYSFQYSESHEQAYWIGYELTKKETEKAFDRTDDFIPDPLVVSGSATQADYAGSGYDRGHLAPAADMGWSRKSMEESFYFSNISPQAPSFNRGIWKRLEEQVRSWAIVYDSIYVVTGPVLKAGLPTIGPNKVSVPEYYYKVILDNTGKDKKAIGFLMANVAGKGTLESFAVSVDRVEKETDIDFFNKLPDGFESKIEKELCLPCWTWTITKPAAGVAGESEESSDEPEGTAVKNQCKGMTQAGARCKRTTSDESGYCYQHKP